MKYLTCFQFSTTQYALLNLTSITLGTLATILPLMLNVWF